MTVGSRTERWKKNVYVGWFYQLWTMRRAHFCSFLPSVQSLQKPYLKQMSCGCSYATAPERIKMKHLNWARLKLPAHTHKIIYSTRDLTNNDGKQCQKHKPNAGQPKSNYPGTARDLAKVRLPQNSMAKTFRCSHPGVCCWNAQTFTNYMTGSERSSTTWPSTLPPVPIMGCKQQPWQVWYPCGASVKAPRGSLHVPRQWISHSSPAVHPAESNSPQLQRIVGAVQWRAAVVDGMVKLQLNYSHYWSSLIITNNH